MDGIDAWTSYLESWNGRLRAAILDLAILYLASYSPKKPHAYSIYKTLQRVWTKHTPPLPTIYSTINRLEENGFLVSESEIENNRVRKTISPSNAGWELLEAMQNDLKHLLTTFDENLTILDQEDFENE